MDASRDENRVVIIICVSSIDLETPVVVAVNPSTNALLVEIA
jgi:hypothetical protein